MKVVLIIAALLLVAVSAAAFVPVGRVPVAEPFRQYLPPVTLGLAILVLIAAFLQPRHKTPSPTPAAEPTRPAPERPQANRADAEIVHFLSMLQEKGRLVDFLMDDINAYSDAQVGAAARVVHAGCKGVLQDHFSINPVRTEPEGSTVQVPAGYSADEYRLVGKIAGSAPFSGVLVHRGWKTDSVKLPQLLRGAADPLARHSARRGGSADKAPRGRTDRPHHPDFRISRTPSSMTARFSLGIDLGTSNCAMALSDLDTDQTEIVPIPQILGAQPARREADPGLRAVPAASGGIPAGVVPAALGRRAGSRGSSGNSPATTAHSCPIAW